MDLSNQGAKVTKDIFNPKPVLHFLFALIIWLSTYFIARFLVPPEWHLIIGYAIGMINGIILAKGWM